MGERPKGYGLTRELAEKTAAKYNPEDELTVKIWLEERTGLEMEGSGQKALRDYLIDGVVLQRLMSSFDEKWGYQIKDTSKAKIPAMRMSQENENIGKFLECCEKRLGMDRQDMFQTVNIQDSTNMHQVIITLFALSSQALSKNFAGPHIGTTVSAKNERNFDQQTLKAGQNVIGLQMGTNQVASQRGMTGYGQTRQIVHKTD